MKRLLIVLLVSALLPFCALSEAKPVIITPSLPVAMSGIHYGLRIQAQGEQPMHFHHAGDGIDAGTMPKGLKLSQSGVLSGTPLVPGEYWFTVRVTNPAGSTFLNYALNVIPYDESRLNAGGEAADILGEGKDSLDGVANAINGGRITRQGQTVFFMDLKGYLYSLDAPFERKPERMFSARKYAHIDSNAEHLYYYQRYLDNDATKASGVSTYVTRIAQDPIVGPGRNTLHALTWEDFSSLSITREILLYIGYDHTMGRVTLENKGASDLRMYYAGREIKADLAIPFNGKVYFREPGTGHLYEAWLDGELARPVVQESVSAYTIGKADGQARLYYADKDKQLFSVTLTGEDRQRVAGYTASALNAGEEALFMADAANGNRLTMLPYDRMEDASVLSDLAVNQIYTLENSVAFRQTKSGDLYLLQLESGAIPVRLIR